ncbi:substrate-binding periplasmic protein [Vibrio sp. NTOU-M3]|uniref:substrate-binding periplasmic protein n=1 Tax=Vibrio sp. NTOU-M3 TaxID=3234954 RepID=UPI00349F3996
MRCYTHALILIVLLLPTLARAQSLTVICEENMPPFSWTEDNQAKGIAVEVIQAILKELDLSVSVQLYPWARAYRMGLNHSNTLICTMARTKEREQKFKWAGEIFSSPPVLLALRYRTDIHIASFNDLNKFRIGTHRDSFRERYLLSKGLILGESVIPEGSNILNYKKLKKGRVDLWSIPLLLGYYIVHQDGGRHEELVQVAYSLQELPQGQHIAFSLDTDDEVVDAFKRALSEIKNNGTYEKIFNKYMYDE